MDMGLPVLPPVGVPIIFPLRAPLKVTQKFSADEKVVYVQSRALLDEARRSGSWNDRQVERTMTRIEQQVSAFFQKELDCNK